MANTESEFVDNVMGRVEGFNTAIEERDKPHLRNEAGRMFRGGWSLADAVMFLTYTEEVNPEIPEEVALRRMKVITDKYPNYRYQV